MRTFRLLLPFAVLIAAAPLAAQQSQVLEVDVPAPALAGNRVGSETTQSAAIYLPPGYTRETSRRYPVLYLLHGIFDSHETWTGFFEIPALLDRLIAAGTIPPVIVVMPNGGNRYGGGYYMDSPTSGGWATYITRDLVGYVDARYRTRANADGRAVLGHSMGGYGAIHLAMEKPGVFSVAYAMSPCCLAPVEDIGFGNVAWRTAFDFDEMSDYEAALERRDFYPVAVLGFLSAMSPDTSRAAAPFFVDFPFEMERMETVTDDDEWIEYSERFPLGRIDQRRAQLTSLRALGMDYGTGDQFVHIPFATAAFSERLAELRIPHLLDVYAGDHRQQLGERLERFVLPWVANALPE